MRALYKGGIRAIEYTNRGEQALKNFAVMRKVCNEEMKDMYLGIGTIKNAEMAKAFIDLGTDFIVLPGTGRRSSRRGRPARLVMVPRLYDALRDYQSGAIGCKADQAVPRQPARSLVCQHDQRIISRAIIHAHRWCGGEQRQPDRLVQIGRLLRGHGQQAGDQIHHGKQAIR